MTEIEIGRGKRGRRAYAFDDIAVVPSRRTRDPKEVSIAWQIDAYRFELPFLAAPMDSVVSPATAIRIGELGGLGVLNLEGLWTRYEDPQPLLDEIAELEQARVDRGRIVGVDGGRAAAQDQRDRVARADRVGGGGVRDELRVNAALADAPRDQLRVLPAEVDDEDGTLFRGRLRERHHLSAGNSAPPS